MLRAGAFDIVIGYSSVIHSILPAVLSIRPSLFIGAKGTESSMHIDSGGTNFWLYLLSGVACIAFGIVVSRDLNVTSTLTLNRSERMGVL